MFRSFQTHSHINTRIHIQTHKAYHSFSEGAGLKPDNIQEQS